MSIVEEKLIVIKPTNTIGNILSEVIESKDLLYYLAWKDYKVRYKQTVIGASWAVVKPLITMVIFTIVFGKLAKLPSGNIPYPILVFTAMLPWYFFATIIQDSSHSLINNAGMISKIYFPRIILPLSSLLVNILDFVIAFSILCMLMIYYQVFPDSKIVLLPFLLFWAAITAIGVGIWFSALIVRYRDFRYVIPFILQVGLYISPVGFSSSIVPENWQLIYSINPMVGVIDGFRWSLIGESHDINHQGLIISMSVSILLFTTGIYYFQKSESKFADII